MSLFLDLDTDSSPDDIQSVKARYVEALMRCPGVVSVGIGLVESGDRPSIIIGVETDDPSIINNLPSELGGHPVEIQIIGSVRPF